MSHFLPSHKWWSCMDMSRYLQTFKHKWLHMIMCRAYVHRTRSLTSHTQFETATRQCNVQTWTSQPCVNDITYTETMTHLNSRHQAEVGSWRYLPKFNKNTARFHKLCGLSLSAWVMTWKESRPWLVRLWFCLAIGSVKLNYMSRYAQNTVTNFMHWTQDSNMPMQRSNYGKKNAHLVSIKDIYWHSVADMKLQKSNPGAT